jgi:hypothetical protein
MSQADLRQLLNASGQRGRAQKRLPAVNRFRARSVSGFGRLGIGIGFRLLLLLLVQRGQDGANVTLVTKLESTVSLNVNKEIEKK